MDKYFQLFCKWVSHSTIVSELIDLSKTNVSHRTLFRYFYVFLNNVPQPTKLSKKQHINLKTDATYFGRWGCCIVFKENENIIFWHFCIRENYHTYLYCLSRLTELGYTVDSVTSDKHKSILSAVNTIFNDIPHQLCLVHVQRRCKTLLTKKPETKAGKQLLEIVLLINQIKNKKEMNIFVKWIERYENKHIKFINNKTYAKYAQIPQVDIKTGKPKTWWYTHKSLRLAFVHLKSALPNMFFYLENENIPKDTNGLEAEFTHLKTKLKSHRGLTRDRQMKYVCWYWFQKSIYNN